MADVYCDMDLTTGNDDGTDWTNAYKLLEGALDGVNVAAGDILWAKGTETFNANITLTGSNTLDDPVIVLGVKSATSNEPPIQSDLIPGWRTGETRTLANRAYKDGDAPTLTRTITDQRIFFDDSLYMYGFVFRGDAFEVDVDSGTYEFEECLFDTMRSSSGSLRLGASNRTIKSRLLNCGLDNQGTTSGIGLIEGDHELIGLEFVGTVVTATGLLGSGVGRGKFIGCDFSALSSAVLQVGNANLVVSAELINCKMHASVALVSGTVDAPFRLELHNCDSTSGKSSGSLQAVDIAESRGDILLETTAVRTGGATDGEAGLHSTAYTPNVNRTQDQYAALVGPWMAFWVTNSDTAVTVYIANSGAGDYNDDDAWLEIMDVSEGGTAQHTHLTTQMDLLATPAVITDDGVSSWGSGGNNPQKFVVTISPDYSGWAYCRVHFAKNFGSSPETLFVDPNPVTS